MVGRDVYWPVCGQGWTKGLSRLSDPFMRDIVGEVVASTGQGGFVGCHHVSLAKAGTMFPESSSL